MKKTNLTKLLAISALIAISISPAKACDWECELGLHEYNNSNPSRLNRDHGEIMQRFHSQDDRILEHGNRPAGCIGDIYGNLSC